jgi:hypothetical protein
MDHLKNWWAVHATWITTFILVPALPALQSVVAAHPSISTAFGGAMVILAKVTKQPQAG